MLHYFTTFCNKILAFFMGLLLVMFTSFAKIPKPKKILRQRFFRSAEAGDAIKALNARIHRIERLSGVQMVVVLVNKLPNEYDIEEYALFIGRKWHVGKNKDGIVYVAAIKQRKQRLEIVRKQVDKLTDEKYEEILNAIKPFFREKDYGGGLQAMVEGVENEVLPPKPVLAPSAPVLVKNNPQPQSKMSNGKSLIYVLFVFAITAGVVWLIVRLKRSGGKNYNSDYTDYNTPIGSNYSRRGYGYRSSGVGPAIGGFAAGYAARAIQDHLRHDHERERHYADHSIDNTDREPEPDIDYNINDSDRESLNWGKWDSNSNRDDSNSSGGGGSSNRGFDGGSGATSDW